MHGIAINYGNLMDYIHIVQFLICKAVKARIQIHLIRHKAVVERLVAGEQLQGFRRNFRLVHR